MRMETVKNIGCGCALSLFVLIGFIVLIVVMGLRSVGDAIAANAQSPFGADSGEYGTEQPECDKPLEKRWMCGRGGKEDPEVAYIPMCGIIADAQLDEGMFADAVSGYARALASIRAATRDKKIRGICLKLDTPGGTVTDADIMADALRRFKAADTNRFVMVMMGSMCCSGGYYVAAEADWIMATPTTLTGSIGVIMRGFNAAELAKKIGVKSVVIASGTNKALLNPLEPVDPEHVKILRRPVEQDYERFVSLVAGGRKLPVEKVKRLADGRILSAQDALEAGLIDGLGYDEEAWEKAAELAKVKKVRIYRYKEPFSWKKLFSEDSFMKFGRAFVGGMTSGAEKPHNEYCVP